METYMVVGRGTWARCGLIGVCFGEGCRWERRVERFADELVLLPLCFWWWRRRRRTSMVGGMTQKRLWLPRGREQSNPICLVSGRRIERG